MNAVNPNWTAPVAQPVGYPRAGVAPVAGPVHANAMSVVARLGTQSRLLMDGSVLYNEPLVRQIVQMGPTAIPALQNFFMSVNNIPALLEGLYTAERMASLGMDVRSLTPAIARWNTHPDPLVQMNLARFYRKINDPGTFGPMMATLVNQAVNRYASLASPNYNVSKEVGETVLDQIANRTADVLMQRLNPFWQVLLLQQQAQEKKK
jgi:hypothetical protein